MEKTLSVQDVIDLILNSVFDSGNRESDHRDPGKLRFFKIKLLNFILAFGNF